MDDTKRDITTAPSPSDAPVPVAAVAQPRKVQRKRAHVPSTMDLTKRVRTATPIINDDSKDMTPEEDNSAPTLAILYSPSAQFPDLSSYIGKLVEIRIAAKYLSIRNKEVARHQLWGTDVYTDDSDIVAILQHTGRMMLRASPPSNLVGLSVIIRVLASSESHRDNYVGTLRYHYRSRDWSPAYPKTSITVISEEKIQGGTLNNPKGQKEPAPTIVRMTPIERAAGKSTPFSLIRKPDLPDVAVVYNAANEPCLKYSISIMRDLAMRPEDWTSSRLKREVFYFETSAIPAVTYELVREKDATTRFDQYRWSEVIRDTKPRPVLFTTATTVASSPSSSPTSLATGRRTKRKGGASASPSPPPSEETKIVTVRAPLEAPQVRVVERALDWEDFEWSTTSVNVRGVTYPLHAFWAVPISS